MHMFKFSKMALDGRFQQFLHFVKKQRKSPVQKLLKCPIAETASSSYTEYRRPGRDPPQDGTLPGCSFFGERNLSASHRRKERNGIVTWRKKSGM